MYFEHVEKFPVYLYSGMFLSCLIHSTAKIDIFSLFIVSYNSSSIGLAIDMNVCCLNHCFGLVRLRMFSWLKGKLETFFWHPSNFQQKKTCWHSFQGFVVWFPFFLHGLPVASKFEPEKPQKHILKMSVLALLKMSNRVGQRFFVTLDSWPLLNMNTSSPVFAGF